MTSTVENLLLDSLGCVDSERRSYEEALAALRTSRKNSLSGRKPLTEGSWKEIL